jgi:lipoprotein-releasing system permease protein
MVRGRFPIFQADGYTVEVLLSTKIASILMLDLEDEVLVYFVQNPPRYRKLLVTGIYETGLEDFDDKFIIGDLNLVRRLNDWESNQVGGVEVFIDPNKEVSEAQSILFDQIAADLYVESIEQKYLQLFDWLALLHRNVYIFLTLILLVASFSMVSILLILIMERTNMIGILKSLGATNQMIRKIFIVSGTQLLTKGLFWGNSIGLGLALMQYYFKIIPLDQENYYMDFVPIYFDLRAIIGVNLLTCLLIVLSFFIPISIINLIQPVQTVRFD